MHLAMKEERNMNRFGNRLRKAILTVCRACSRGTAVAAADTAAVAAVAQ